MFFDKWYTFTELDGGEIDVNVRNAQEDRLIVDQVV